MEGFWIVNNISANLGRVCGMRKTRNCGKPCKKGGEELKPCSSIDFKDIAWEGMRRISFLYQNWHDNWNNQLACEVSSIEWNWKLYILCRGLSPFVGIATKWCHSSVNIDWSFWFLSYCLFSYLFGLFASLYWLKYHCWCSCWLVKSFMFQLIGGLVHMHELMKF